MKKLVVLLLALQSSRSWATTLPKPCEDLAWKLASVQDSVEDYSEITNVTQNSEDGMFSALVKVTDVAWYSMAFLWNHKTHTCLIKTLEGEYR